MSVWFTPLHIFLLATDFLPAEPQILENHINLPRNSRASNRNFLEISDLQIGYVAKYSSMSLHSNLK